MQQEKAEKVEKYQTLYWLGIVPGMLLSANLLTLGKVCDLSAYGLGF